jgi:hypothetical protein
LRQRVVGGRKRGDKNPHRNSNVKNTFNVITMMDYEYLLRKAEEEGLKEILDIFLESVREYQKAEKIVRETEDVISSKPEITTSFNSF